MSSTNSYPIQVDDLIQPTLFTTLYAKDHQKEKVDKLVSWLSSGLTPFDTVQVDSQAWVNQDETRMLYHFPSTTASDTSILQLILNDDRPVTTAWPDMYRQLINLLDHQALTVEVGLSGHEMLKELTWGYTLIYQAQLKVEDGIDLNTVSLENFVSTIRSPSIPENETPQPLAHSNVSQSRLWLMGIPSEGDGFKAGMVYVVLNPSEKEADDIGEKVLVGPVATWLMPDLIAHKSYHEMRQYKLDNNRTDYNEQLKYLRQSAGQILKQVNPKALGLTKKLTTESENLPQQYGYVVGTRLPGFYDLRVSLERQLYNYQQWWKKSDNGNILSDLGDEEILAYHQSKIKTAVLELQLLVDEGKNAVEAVRVAVEARRTETEVRREQQQQIFNMLLTAVGLGLATSQIVDSRAAEEVLKLPMTQHALNLIGLTFTPDYRLHQLIVQFATTILVVVIVLGGWTLIKYIAHIIRQYKT